MIAKVLSNINSNENNDSEADDAVVAWLVDRLLVLLLSHSFFLGWGGRIPSPKTDRMGRKMM